MIGPSDLVLRWLSAVLYVLSLRRVPERVLSLDFGRTAYSPYLESLPWPAFSPDPHLMRTSEDDAVALYLDPDLP